MPFYLKALHVNRASVASLRGTLGGVFGKHIRRPSVKGGLAHRISKKNSGEKLFRVGVKMSPVEQRAVYLNSV